MAGQVIAAKAPRLSDPQKALDALVRGTRKQAEKLARDAADGSISPSEFGDRMAELLEDRHTLAVVLGRHKGGDTTPVEDDDRRFAELVVDGEAEFLQKFAADLKAGRYDEAGDAAAQRATLYAGKLTGTANEVLALTLPGETVWEWKLGATEEHCPDCPRLAADGPYAADDLPAHPGSGMTACLANCDCSLVAGEVVGFTRPD